MDISQIKALVGTINEMSWQLAEALFVKVHEEGWSARKLAVEIGFGKDKIAYYVRLWTQYSPMIKFVPDLDFVECYQGLRRGDPSVIHNRLEDDAVDSCVGPEIPERVEPAQPVTRPAPTVEPTGPPTPGQQLVEEIRNAPRPTEPGIVPLSGVAATLQFGDLGTSVLTSIDAMVGMVMAAKGQDREPTDLYRSTVAEIEDSLAALKSAIDYSGEISVEDFLQ